MLVQLINPFAVPVGKNMGAGDGTILYINVAVWQSAEAWNCTQYSYKPEEKSIPGVEHHPGIFAEAIYGKWRHKAG